MLKYSPKDGELLFLLGRCYEEGRDDPDAIPDSVLKYREAIEHDAPQKIEASERLAMLLREKLDKPEEADQVMKKLVADDPNNYRVHLAQGRYRVCSRLAISHSNPSFRTPKKTLRRQKTKHPRSLKSISNWLKPSLTR